MSRIQPINGGSPITYNQIQYKKYVHRPWNRAVLQVVGDLNIFYSLGDSGVFITLWPWRPRLLRPKKRLGENTVGVVVVCKEERKHNWDWGWDWDNFRSVFVWTKNRRRCCLWFIFQVSWVWLYNLSFVWKYWNNHTVSILTFKKKKPYKVSSFKHVLLQLWGPSNLPFKVPVKTGSRVGGSCWVPWAGQCFSPPCQKWGLREALWSQKSWWITLCPRVLNRKVSGVHQKKPGILG